MTRQRTLLENAARVFDRSIPAMAGTIHSARMNEQKVSKYLNQLDISQSA